MKFVHVSGKNVILYSILVPFHGAVQLLMKLVHVSGASAILCSIMSPFHAGLQLFRNRGTQINRQRANQMCFGGSCSENINKHPGKHHAVKEMVKERKFRARFPRSDQLFRFWRLGYDHMSEEFRSIVESLQFYDDTIKALISKFSVMKFTIAFLERASNIISTDLNLIAENPTLKLEIYFPLIILL